MKRFLKYLAVLLVVCAVVAGGYWYYRTRAAASAAASADSFTQVVAVRQGSLNATISVVGELAAVQQATLQFDRLSGTTALQSLAVAAGNLVEKDQILATIDPTSFQQALDQAKSALQAAEDNLTDLQTPATALELTQADVAVAQAELNLQQAREDLAVLTAPDLTDLRNTLRTAQDNLALARLQQTLAARDSLAKSERDLLYAVAWHERKINELQTLVSSGKANLEQTGLLAEEQNTLGETQAQAAKVQAQRDLALRLAAANVTTTEATVADARQALADAQAGGSALDLAKANLAVKTAEVNLADVQQKRADLDAGADAATLAAAQADLDKKRLAVADAEADLAGATLRAPFSGTILSTYVDQGNLITANAKILTLANLNELKVLAAVDETTIRQVKTDQQATITFDAFPGQTFTGQVLSIPLQGTLQGGVMVYEVPISLQGAGDLPLLVGMTANVSIQVGQVENALLVPAMAIQTIGGTNQVEIPGATADAQPQSVPVEIGLSNGVYTQIVRGLNLGDQVVVQMQTSQTQQFGFPGGGAFIMEGGSRPPRD